jgi:16S rRNA (guanine(966)-N(2))-methyltransferase RsmD
MDGVKEYIFNVISERVEGAEVCDLFAGTGSLGIEALSRGSARVTFVDVAAESARIIRANLENLGIAADASVVREEAFRFAHRTPARPYDIVFCDPPYGFAGTEKIIGELIAGGVVSPGGIVVAEHEAELLLPERIGPFLRLRQRSFGRTTISIFGSG